MFYSRSVFFLSNSIVNLNPKMHKGGGLVYPAVVFYLLLKISLGNPYMKMFNLSKLFCCGCPSKYFVYSLSEHFEIWVRKSPMHERVKRLFVCKMSMSK